MERDRTHTPNTRMAPVTRHTRRNPLKALAGGLLAGVLFAACQGDNLFVGLQRGLIVDATDVPSVEILDPPPGQVTAKPLQDSLLVTVDLSDQDGITSVVFEALALRGDAALGTDVAVPRFASKTVNFVGPTPDTIVTRYLQPLAEATLEVVAVIVTAFDADANFTADTVQIFLGGPSVEILNFVGGEIIQSGRILGLRVQAKDPIGVQTVVITLSGVVNTVITQTISPALDSLVLDTIVNIPAGNDGTLTISASARNTVDVVGAGAPVVLTVTSVVAGGDNTPPGVTFATISTERSELAGVVSVEITAQDDTQGGGVGRMGYTVLGISPRRGDTLFVSDEIVFATPRTGAVTQTFEFTVFNADFLALPDTVVYEVFAYAVDASAATNCGASVGEAGLVSYECGTLSGFTVAEARIGERLTLVIVGGETVLLPSGGKILDGVIDPVRRNLYLSNVDLNQVEVFRLETRTFLPAVAVGSQPWGLALNKCYGGASVGCGDTLLVANSGGTNITSVFLEGLAGTTPGIEIPNSRILTPDNIPFNARLEDTDVGVIWNVSALNVYSDRPQFLAMDQNRQIHFSTWPTAEGSEKGTIRRAFVPAPTLAVPNPNPEVQFHGLQIPGAGNPNEWGILHIDYASLGRNPTFQMFDHVSGDLSMGITELVNTVLLDPTHYLNFLAQGSDIAIFPKAFTVDDLGLTDTTFVAASGDGRAVAFGEGNKVLDGRRIMVYQAVGDTITAGLQTEDLGINKDDFISGLGLNFDASLGVARGKQAYFFTMDLRLQGIATLASGGAGAAMHPLHANAVALDNPAGTYTPDTHTAFIGSGANAIDVYDTFHFFRSGRVAIKDVVNGPLRAVLPFPADNVGLTCATVAVFDRDGTNIGSAVEVYNNNDFFDPHPALGGPTEDACVVVKLFATTDAGGVVVVNVTKADILSLHPSRL